jgi:hypothetical protein
MTARSGVQWIVDAFGQIRPPDAQGQGAGRFSALGPFGFVRLLSGLDVLIVDEVEARTGHRQFPSRHAQAEQQRGCDNGG